MVVVRKQIIPGPQPSSLQSAPAAGTAAHEPHSASFWTAQKALSHCASMAQTVPAASDPAGAEHGEGRLFP